MAASATVPAESVNTPNASRWVQLRKRGKFDERPVGPHDQGLWAFILRHNALPWRTRERSTTRLRWQSFWRNFVAVLRMRVRAGPLCGRERGAPEKNGISGAVILYESHAAIHSNSQLRSAFLDIFSCVPFGAANRPLRINESPVNWPFQS